MQREEVITVVTFPVFVMCLTCLAVNVAPAFLNSITYTLKEARNDK
jgi:hypothetical protein